MEYDHPSGAFSLILPRLWSVYAQNTTTLATAAFSAPGAEQPALLFAVINLGQTVDSSEFGAIIERYQTQVRADTGHYVEQSREAMGDGSWRMTGLRAGVGGVTERVNTFIEREGAFIGLIEVLVPADPAAFEPLQAIINSFSIHDDAPLQPTDLTTLAYAKDSRIGVLHVAAWNTPAGVFFVTGEVANYGLTSITDVPVQVDLQTADGLSVTGAVDQVMGYGIPPGGFAPFSLRFGEGQPALATNYRLTLGSADWQPAADADVPTIYGQDALTWTDQSSFDTFNRLVVSGVVTNVSDHVVHDPRATVTVFNSVQNVIAAGFADITPAELAAGAEADFEITLPEMGGDPANYIVSVQGVP